MFVCARVFVFGTKIKKIKKGNKRTINYTLLSVSYLQLNGEHAVCAPSWNIDINALFPSWIGHVWPLKLCWQPRKGCGRSPRKVTLVPFCANSSAFNSRQTTDAARGQFGSGNLELTAVTRPTAIEVLGFRKWLEEIKFISGLEMRLYANSRSFFKKTNKL